MPVKIKKKKAEATEEATEPEVKETKKPASEPIKGEIVPPKE